MTQEATFTIPTLAISWVKRDIRAINGLAELEFKRVQWDDRRGYSSFNIDPPTSFNMLPEEAQDPTEKTWWKRCQSSHEKRWR